MFIDHARELAATLDGGRQLLLERLQVAELRFRMGDLDTTTLAELRRGWQEAHSAMGPFDELNEALLSELEDPTLDRQLHELFLSMAAWMDDPDLASRESDLRLNVEAALLASRILLDSRPVGQDDLGRVFSESSLAEEREAAWRARQTLYHGLAGKLGEALTLEEQRAGAAGYEQALDRELALRGMEPGEWRRWLDLLWELLLPWGRGHMMAERDRLAAGVSGKACAEALLGGLWPDVLLCPRVPAIGILASRAPEELFRDTCDLLGLDAGPVLERTRGDQHELPAVLRGLLPSPAGQVPFALLDLRAGLHGLDDQFRAGAAALARSLPDEALPPTLGTPLPEVETACGAVLCRLARTPVWIQRLLDQGWSVDLGQLLEEHDRARLLRLVFLLRWRLDHAEDRDNGWRAMRGDLFGSPQDLSTGLDWSLDELATAPIGKLLDLLNGELLAAHLVQHWRGALGEDLLKPELGGGLLLLLRVGRLLPLEDLLEQAGLPALTPRALCVELGAPPEDPPPLPETLA